jgi:hypothetical protein
LNLIFFSDLRVVDDFEQCFPAKWQGQFLKVF